MPIEDNGLPGLTRSLFRFGNASRALEYALRRLNYCKPYCWVSTNLWQASSKIILKTIRHGSVRPPQFLLFFLILFYWTGISRSSRHKRSETGAQRARYRKKRKFELGRQPANTKLGSKRVHTVRVRGGNLKYRALRLDSGNFAWGSEHVTRKTRIIGVVSIYPATVLNDESDVTSRTTMHRTTNLSEPTPLSRVRSYKSMLLLSVNGMNLM